MEIVEFLTTCLDEDERIARESGGAAWEELPVSGWVHTSPLPTTEWQPPGYDHHVASAPSPADRAHIARHDPARVLREIDAKRKILAECAYWHDKLSAEAANPPPVPYPGLGQILDAVTPVLRALALPYADRAGYQESWRP